MGEAKIIGLGGVFIKFRSPKEMTLWYKEVLGLITNDYGILFAYNARVSSRAFMQISPFDQTSTYFGNDKQQVMLNFRVQNLVEFQKKLSDRKVSILDEIEEFEYGKFLHISDPEGNRIELWEPIDSVFEDGESYQDML